MRNIIPSNDSETISLRHTKAYSVPYQVLCVNYVIYEDAWKNLWK